MASLKLTDINKVYPSGETALYGVNLEAGDREFLVITGAELSGKSTVLRVIAGLEDATSGGIYIDGKDVSDVEPKDRNVAMVFRSSTLYPALNVFDNIAFGLRQRKAPEALVKERVKAVAGILGLSEVLYRKPKVLTAAAKQRVAIARAVAREPRLYLLDEPLAGLDAKLRADLLNIIINLQARMEGTFVYSTKNVAEALSIGTRVVVLKDGFVQQIDTPANLYDYPANTYVAFYIGSPTVNFIKKVSIESENGGYTAKFTGGEIPLNENISKRFTNISEYAGTGKYVTLGVRPEDASVTSAEGLLKTVVSSVEGEGEKYADCIVTPDISLKVSVNDEVVKGARTGININIDKLMIFDAETCLTLLERDGGYKNTGHADADRKPLPYNEESAIAENLRPKKNSRKK